MRVALLFATTAALLAAQSTRFGVRSRLVIVPVNVFDANGNAIPALDAPDFTVLDNGRPQKIAVDSIDTGVAPIALAIVVETVGVSRAAIENIRQVGAMIQPLVTGERGCAGLVTFDERVTWIEDCTKDADALVRGFRRLRVSERQTKARMLDATSSAIDHLAKRENVRRILLLISETRDRGSETKADAVIAAAQMAGVTIYALPYSPFATAFASKAPVGEQKPARTPTTPSEAYGTRNGAPPGKLNPRVPPPERRVDYLGAIREAAHMSQENVADALAKSTGGAEFPFVTRKALETAIRKLGEDLHSQYVLTFMPERPEPGYHELTVRVTRRESARVRARPGYRAPDEGK